MNCVGIKLWKDKQNCHFSCSDVSSNQFTSANPQPNGLTRSRRSHFSHSDTLIEEPKTDGLVPKKQQSINRISYENERLLHFAKSPHSWALPRDWVKMCELYPTIVRNKVRDFDERNNNNHSHPNGNANYNNNNNIKANSSTNAAGFRRRGVSLTH